MVEERPIKYITKEARQEWADRQRAMLPVSGTRDQQGSGSDQHAVMSAETDAVVRPPGWAWTDLEDEEDEEEEEQEQGCELSDDVSDDTDFASDDETPPTCRAKTKPEHKAQMLVSRSLSISQALSSGGLRPRAKQGLLNQRPLQDVTPALQLLLGSTSIYCDSRTLVDKVLGTIKLRSEKHSGMELRGRTFSLFRIDYDPTVSGITGVRSRLEAVIASKDRVLETEYLLRPLLLWNPAVFPEIARKQLERCKDGREGGRDFVGWQVTMQSRRGDAKRYQSSWLHHWEAYNDIKPITSDKREAVVAAVVASCRSRCQKVCPESLLLHDLTVLAQRTAEEGAGMAEANHAREWSLVNATGAFGAKVLACFDGQGCPSEQCEDLIERCLYGFKIFNRAAVYGVDHAGGGNLAHVGHIGLATSGRRPEQDGLLGSEKRSAGQCAI
ncbi:hypothetical protein LTR36_002189 [Oleoguttula mirabilis]|uniref:Uncharacterized protein n=1 Tax=Oleoguttula mirabilis TaxID=1507867 RepID=A0AAV9JKP8_9PEZI|nr:hypothetical protein LTR36_002189 [Oleoguttula mirabilis]